jgi:hypothetical protein
VPVGKYALSQGRLLSLTGFIADMVVAIVIGLLAYRLSQLRASLLTESVTGCRLFIRTHAIQNSQRRWDSCALLDLRVQGKDIRRSSYVDTKSDCGNPLPEGEGTKIRWGLNGYTVSYD